jgi:hypothetical protein
MTLGLELDRALRKRAGESGLRDLRIRLHPQTKRALEGHQQDLLSGLRESVAGQLDLEADDDLGIDDFEFDPR